MPEYQFFWSKRFAILRTIISFIFWGIVFLLPALIFWMVAVDKGKSEWPVIGIYLGIVSVCCFLHARRYWMRLFDQSPQLELYPTFIRAKQFRDVDVLWKSLTHLRGMTKSIGSDVIDATIFLTIKSKGEIELDTTGLNVPTTEIFRSMESLWRKNRDD